MSFIIPMFMTFSEDARNEVCSVFGPSQNLASFVIYDIRESSHIKVQLHLRLLSGRAPNATTLRQASNFLTSWISSLGSCWRRR